MSVEFGNMKMVDNKPVFVSDFNGKWKKIIDGDTTIFMTRWDLIDGEIPIKNKTLDESIKYSSSIDFTNDRILNEKGRQIVRGWAEQDFMAGANWMEKLKT